MSDKTAQPSELSADQSDAVMHAAADVRPDDAPAPHKLAGADKVGSHEVTDTESATIMSVATNMRPSEDVHPDED